MFHPPQLFAMLFALLLLSIAPAHANLNQLERNTDRPGNDYDNFGTRNAKACAQECRDDHRCKAFTFAQNDKRCWLKDRVPASRHGNRLVSGVKGGGHNGGGGQNNLPSEIGGVTLERHSDRKGSDYRNLHTKNAKVCARTCSHENRCRAFAYQVDAQRCWLKDRVPNRYDFGASVSGVKKRNHGGGGGGHGGGNQGNLPNEVAGVTLERHSDRKGSDYRHLQTGKAEDCAYTCSEERRCKAFAWQTQSQTCFLKNRAPSRYNFRDSVSGVKRGHQQGGGGGGGGNSGDVAGVTIERNSDRKGSDYRNLNTSNAKDCAYLCSQENRCVAFAYQVREKHCWLKDRVPNRYHLRHSVSGVKTNGNHSGGYDNHYDDDNGYDDDDDYDRRRRNAEEMSNSYGAD